MNECCICYDVKKMYPLNCMHKLCINCLEKVNICPLCRKKIKLNICTFVNIIKNNNIQSRCVEKINKLKIFNNNDIIVLCIKNISYLTDNFCCMIESDIDKSEYKINEKNEYTLEVNIKLKDNFLMFLINKIIKKNNNDRILIYKVNKKYLLYWITFQKSRGFYLCIYEGTMLNVIIQILFSIYIINIISVIIVLYLRFFNQHI